MKKERKWPLYVFPCIFVGISLIVFILMLIFGDLQKVLAIGISLIVVNSVFLMALAACVLPKITINTPQKYSKFMSFLNIVMKFVAIALFILIVVQAIKAIDNLINIIKTSQQLSDINNSILDAMKKESESDLTVTLWLIELITKDLLIYVVEIFIMISCLVLKFSTKSEVASQDKSAEVEFGGDKKDTKFVRK